MRRNGTNLAIFPAVLGLLIGTPVFGQELRLKARTRQTVKETSAKIGPERVTSKHEIVQFDHLPGVEDLKALLSAGFLIVGAVPDNAVVVVKNASAARASLASVPNVNWVGQLEVADKISPELENVTGTILAVVEFHMDVNLADQQAIATAEGLTFVRPGVLQSHHAIVDATRAQLDALASYDQIAYIFPANPALIGPAQPGNELMPCAGMLTLAGPIAQYSNVTHGWDLDSDHVAHLGYAFGALTPKVPAATVQQQILTALDAWSAVASVSFAPASSPNAARTVLVEFATGAHGDAYPFDTAGAILAHTFYPVPVNSESIAGDVHLNMDENWHSGGDIEIYTVALHELGHALGLSHSDNPKDVMYPYYQRGLSLSANDIGAVQQLYGAPGAASASASSVTVAPATSSAAVSLTINPVQAPGQAAQISIGGTVSGGKAPFTVQYQTDHGYSGKATVAASGSGTQATWTVSGLTLVTGTNTLTVTGFDASGHTATQSVTVTRTAATTSAAPVSVTITSPSSPVATATGPTISLGGTASGGAGITQVSWQTATGANGTAVGTTQWLASNVPLMKGTNTIMVRATDAKGSSAWTTVVVVNN